MELLSVGVVIHNNKYTKVFIVQLVKLTVFISAMITLAQKHVPVNCIQIIVINTASAVLLTDHNARYPSIYEEYFNFFSCGTNEVVVFY